MTIEHVHNVMQEAIEVFFVLLNSLIKNVLVLFELLGLFKFRSIFRNEDKKVLYNLY